MKVYKGTNEKMQCTPEGKVFQFEQGVTYEKPEAKLCEHGFHACEAPLDVFLYYPPGQGSRYFVAELDEVSPERGDDSKVCGKKITLGAEIGIPGIAKAHVEWVKENIQRAVERGDKEAVAVGDKESAAAGAYGSAAAGWRGSAVSRGCSSTDKNGIAVVRGNGVKAKGGLGTILVIAIEKRDSYDIAEWKAAVVDGETIKADTWYTLKDGEFVEVQDGTNS